jgi:hypothetical protein
LTHLFNVEITEEGRRSFEFVMDQIFNRVIILRYLLIEGNELERIVREVWGGGLFHADKAAYVVEYISDSNNYTADAERVAKTVQDPFVRVRSFVSIYIDDPATRSEVERKLQDLEQLAQKSATRV